MPGNEHERLIKQYQAAVQAYSEAVHRLAGLDGGQFRSAYDQAEMLREVSEQRRTALGRLKT